MQIHEITQPVLKEGFWSNVGKGFVQGVTGVNLPQHRTPADISTAQAAQATQLAASERTVVTVTQPGQAVASNYYKTGNTWTNELGNTIVDPKQTAYLEKLIPTHGRKEPTPVPPVTSRKVSRRRVA
jgi:hypothetical protein